MVAFQFNSHPIQCIGIGGKGKAAKLILVDEDEEVEEIGGMEDGTFPNLDAMDEDDDNINEDDLE